MKRRNFIFASAAAFLAMPTGAEAARPRNSNIPVKDLARIAPVRPGQQMGNGRLSLIHGHLDDRIDIRYRNDNHDLDHEAVEKLKVFLRDFHLDKSVLDLRTKASRATAAAEHAAAGLPETPVATARNGNVKKAWTLVSAARRLRDEVAQAEMRREHEMDVRLLDLVSEIQLRHGGRPLSVVSGYRSPDTNSALAALSFEVSSHSMHMTGQAMDIWCPGVPLPEFHEVAMAMAQGGVGFYQISGFVHVDTGRVRQWTESRAAA